jgi:GNAT superfamily N-acetyltransferase
MIIRDESLADRPHIDLLLDQAFGGTYESRLVARLRHAGFVAVALVAEEGGQLVGHIVMSRLPAQLDGRSVRALALAPMAVRPDRQRRGAGSRLLTAALERARATTLMRSSFSVTRPIIPVSASRPTWRRKSRLPLPAQISWLWSSCRARSRALPARSPIRRRSTAGDSGRRSGSPTC